MADRYISRDSFTELLRGYKDLGRWNTNVCDPDTVLRVLSVIENELAHFETIGPRQTSNKLLAAKDCALRFYEKQACDDVSRYIERERSAEAIGSTMLMGYWRGMRVQAEWYVEVFRRLQGPEHSQEWSNGVF